MGIAGNGVYFLMQLRDIAVVDDEIISDSNRSAFFQIFDFRPIALVNLARLHWSFGALHHTLVAEVFWRDYGDDDDLAGKFVLKDFIFAPSV